MKGLFTSTRYQVTVKESDYERVRAIVERYKGRSPTLIDNMIANGCAGLWPRHIAAIYLRLGILHRMKTTVTVRSAERYVKILKNTKYKTDV